MNQDAQSSGAPIRPVSPSRTVVTTFSSDLASPTSHRDGANEFDEGVYVLCVASPPGGESSSAALPPSSSWPLSCALSDRSVLTYDQSTLKKVHCVTNAHEGPVTDLCHSAAVGGGGGGTTNLVVSSGMDGRVRVFDLRESGGIGGGKDNGGRIARAAVEVRLPRREEALSVSLGYGGALAAVGGGKGHVHFYDLRQAGGTGGGNGDGTAPLGSYVDAHTEEVTQLRFQPGASGGVGDATTLLASAGEDGLVCVHDTSKPTEEAALRSVLNVQAPLREVGFFGPALEGIYCLTGSETLSCWHHESAQRICDFGADFRTGLSRSGGIAVEYLVGCHWDGAQLCLLAGNANGDAAAFRVDAGLVSPTHLLRGGHRGCVRGFVWRSPGTIITGGEDARLCEWNLGGNVNATALAGSPKRNGREGKVRVATHDHLASPQRGGGPARRTKKGGGGVPY